jgi:hypothetical protein
MKFYETHYEEYITQVETHNIHPELNEFKKKIPQDIHEFRNLLVYGPSGSGKYSQALSFIRHYSPSQLKYEKKMIIQTEKGDFSYKISDIHYELDMSLLGCNSKSIWNDVFGQIVDIISMKKDKIGIIVCKNFHETHSELLDIFYSYMQQYNHNNLAIKLRFILITEQISFLPYNIIQHCYRVNVKRPAEKEYAKLGLKEDIEPMNILNLKELHIIQKIKNPSKMPVDLFDIICSNIIDSIDRNKLDLNHLRELLYDILIYNVDVSDVIWFIMAHYIGERRLDAEKLNKIVNKLPQLLKQFNNNYRPIYHLENIFLTIINEICISSSK